ncbi:MAG: FtsX-like permease family protein [Candidatus Bathyarchaeia archaeon]|nr:ABC transporter permease [Candidatus Bathyarchaeota archaeon]
MRFLDIFYLAYKALWTHKVRTTLLILSVTVGIATIIALTSQTEGVGMSITASLQRLGSNTLIVSIRGRTLTDQDLALMSMLEGVRKVIPIIRVMGTVNVGGSEIDVTVYGISAEDLKEILGETKIIDGTLYQDTTIPLAIVGHDIAYPNSTYSAVSVGQAITVSMRGLVPFAGGSPMQAQRLLPVILIVTSILDRYGASFLISPDSSIFIPLQAAQHAFNRGWYDMVIIKAVDVSYISAIEEGLSYIYGGNANIISPTQMAETMQNIIMQMSLLLGSIAAISLIAAALGILNMMLVTITERTREIGTLKAIGLKNKHILAQIIIEGLLIGVFGGVMGNVIGVVASYILPSITLGGMFRPGGGIQTRAGAGRFSPTPVPAAPTMSLSYEPYINPIMMIIAFILAIAVSVVSSLYPAWRAAKMDPARALKYE